MRTDYNMPGCSGGRIVRALFCDETLSFSGSGRSRGHDRRHVVGHCKMARAQQQALRASSASTPYPLLSPLLFYLPGSNTENESAASAQRHLPRCASKPQPAGSSQGICRLSTSARRRSACSGANPFLQHGPPRWRDARRPSRLRRCTASGDGAHGRRGAAC